MLEREDQRAIGKHLRAAYTFTSDSMMPERLSDLVAKLLAMDAQFPAADQVRAASAERIFGDWPRVQNEGCQLG